jgi:hypothetical protein
MRTILAVLVVFLSSISARANSYIAGDAGNLFYSGGSGSWTTRILYLAHYGGDPYMYPTTFTTAGLSTTCTPTCGIGNPFSVDLSMSNFTIREQEYAGVILVGTLNLITTPIILKAQNGMALAKFTLTGNLEACTDLTCSTELFSLSVNIHGPVTVGYSLNSGQVTVSSVQFVLPEPSSMTLFGTGLAFVMGRLRAARMKSRKGGVQSYRDN